MTKEEFRAKLLKNTQMSDEDLDNIAGGTLNESADDLYRLFDVNPEAAMRIVNNPNLSINKNPKQFVKAVAKELSNVGIMCYANTNKPNGYIYMDKYREIFNGTKDEIWAKAKKEHGVK